MFDEFRKTQFNLYNSARNHFLANPQLLIALERFFADELTRLLTANIGEIKRDYNEASYLYPFWQNYPPEERGRQPKGDQFPWIEVGEHAIGAKLPRILESAGYSIRDSGFPVGPDQRLVLEHDEIENSLNSYSRSAWLFVDIKSVGPRDDEPHAVMSHNQVSGDGKWDTIDGGIQNTIMVARGSRASHPFHCTVPPLFVLSDDTIAPVVSCAVKPVYTMLSLQGKGKTGQPLNRITIATVPNGLLMEHGPEYLKKFPGLLYPGKDDKKKKIEKKRARVSFDLLTKIAPWRVQTIHV